MQTIFGIFSLADAETAAADLGQRLGIDRVNVIMPEAAKDRIATDRAHGPGKVPAPTLAHLIGRKRPVFLADPGSVYAANGLAAHVLEMAQSPTPTKSQGSLKVALEEYGVATHFAQAYATSVHHGYVLLFVEAAEPDIVQVSERFGKLGGREVFTFQRLD